MLPSQGSYMALGKSVNLPKPQSPHQYDGRNGACSVHLTRTSEDQGSNLDCERAVTRETCPAISGLAGAVRRLPARAEQPASANCRNVSAGPLRGISPFRSVQRDVLSLVIE